jgi:hypothetical protein
MGYVVELCQIAPQPLAAVRDVATKRDLGQKIRAILSGNAVYTFLKQSGIGPLGFNVILYWDEGEKGLLCTDGGW